MPTRVCGILVASLLLLLSSCSPTQQAPPPATAAQSEENHGHAHAHSHDELGPNGGHLVELGDEEYHVEWTHDDDTGIVTLYVLDGEAKDTVAIAADTISIQARIEGSTEYQKYHLTTSKQLGDPPMASQFQVKDPALIAMLKLAGQGVEASVSVTIDGTPFTGEFEHHEQGHGH